MTTFYSNHYGPAIGATGHFTALRAPMDPVSVGLSHARLRRTAAQLIVPATTDMASGDIVRLLDLRSTDRLYKLLFSMDANFGDPTDINVGLYKKGGFNDGAVIDVDLFEAAVDWKGAIARVDSFTNGALDHWDRGKALWELANIGLAASTYNASTSEAWTVALTTSSNTATVAAAVEFLVEAYYVAGD